MTDDIERKIADAVRLFNAMALEAAKAGRTLTGHLGRDFDSNALRLDVTVSPADDAGRRVPHHGSGPDNV